MHILITGAAGFVGRNLTAALRAQRAGDTLYLFDTDTAPELLDTYCQTADFVFHIAGVNRPEDSAAFMHGNRDFFAMLLSSLERCGNTCPVMLASSEQAAYADTPYGESKRAAEALAAAYAARTGARMLIYRFPHLFGKWCRPHYNSVIATFCSETAQGRAVCVNDPKKELLLAYIDDVTEELLRALQGEETREGDFCTVPVTYRATVGFLADTIGGFSRLGICAPNTADLLVRKLYATYLSYLPSGQRVMTLPMHADARGSFTELLRTPDRGQMSVNSIRPGMTKGNHWHQSKNERFFVLKGDARVAMRRMDGGENGAAYPAEEYLLSGGVPQMLHVPPGYAHSIANPSDEEELIVLIWADTCFDPALPDTYPAVAEDMGE